MTKALTLIHIMIGIAKPKQFLMSNFQFCFTQATSKRLVCIWNMVMTTCGWKSSGHIRPKDLKIRDEKCSICWEKKERNKNTIIYQKCSWQPFYCYSLYRMVETYHIAGIDFKDGGIRANMWPSWHWRSRCAVSVPTTLCNDLY